MSGQGFATIEYDGDGSVYEALPVAESDAEREWLICERDPAYFAVRHLFTVDPWDGGRVKLFPPYPYLVNYLRRLSAPGNIHLGKSRKMLASWATPAWFLWAMAFRPNFVGLMASRLERLVDDGGENATVESLFGRLLFMHQNLHPAIKSRFPLDCAHLRYRNPSNGAILVGSATGKDLGRGGTHWRLLVDEAAFIPQSEGAHRALSLACPDGKIYQSTPDGPNNMFARLRREHPENWEFLQFHWTQHPDRWDGRECDSNGVPTSAWYRQACEDMTPEGVARELDISYERSASGLVFPQFFYDVHVRSDIAYNPDLPIRLGTDFGIGAPTAVWMFQETGKEAWGLGVYEMAGEVPEVHAKAIDHLARKIGYYGDRRVFKMHGDPAGNAREMVKGSRVTEEYRSLGFHVDTPRHPFKVGIELHRKMLHQRRIFHSVECGDLLRDRYAGYRFPTDEYGNAKSDDPVHDINSHIMDGIRYGLTARFPVTDGINEFKPRPLGSLPPPPKEWWNDRPRFGSASHARTMVGPRKEY